MASRFFDKAGHPTAGSFMPTAFACAGHRDIENTTYVVFFAFFAVIIAIIALSACVLGLRLSLAVLGVLIQGLVLGPASPLGQQ